MISCRSFLDSSFFLFVNKSQRSSSFTPAKSELKSRGPTPVFKNYDNKIETTLPTAASLIDCLTTKHNFAGLETIFSDEVWLLLG